MTRLTRPHHGSKTDANQAQLLKDFSRMVGGWTQVQDEKGRPYQSWVFSIRGVTGWIIVCSDIGGLALDLRLYIGDVARDIEIKTPEAYAAPGHSLTAGEALYFETSPNTGAIVCDAEGLYAVAEKMAIEEMRRK